MHPKMFFPTWTVEPRWPRSLVRETQICWQVVVYDFSSTVMPAFLFSTAAWVSASSPKAMIWALLHNLVYFCLYAFTFCLSNQIAGIEEDRINKPTRPLVTGLVSYRGAQVRWVVSMVLFTLLGWSLGVVEWTLLWQASLTMYNFGGWAKKWFTKNLVMSLGVVAQLAAAWQLVTPLTLTAWCWILVVAGVVFPLISLQDLRDIDGDRSIGRKTFPLAVGENATRAILGIGFALLPVIVHYILMQPAGNAWYVLLCEMGVTIISLTIAIRVVMCRTMEGDHRTYMLFTYWYCGILSSAIIIMAA